MLHPLTFHVNVNRFRLPNGRQPYCQPAVHANQRLHGLNNLAEGRP